MPRSQQRERQRQRQRRTSSALWYLQTLLLSLILCTLIINIYLHNKKGALDESSDGLPGKFQHLAPSKDSNPDRVPASPSKDKHVKKNFEHAVSPGSSLSCERHGGPSSDREKSEMIYWSDIPSDTEVVSPFLDSHSEEKYLTFEPDGGGFNNIRMAMETFIVMAHAMGRTLVLPPAQGMYLLRQDRGKQKTHFSFGDFFPLETINKKHHGMKIISTEEFLIQMAMTGKLLNKTSGIPSFPPNNQTDWNGQDNANLKTYLRDVTFPARWKPMKCLAGFPTHTNVTALQRAMTDILQDPRQYQKEDFVSNPVAVDAPAIQRLREMRVARTELCVYDEEMRASPAVHFMYKPKEKARILAHFYTFLFFEDWRRDLWSRRFVRDYLRYTDQLQCAAARIVAAIRKRAVKKREGSEGVFDAFHIRRGDFEYKRTRVSAQVIYENSRAELEDGATVYIATDERNKTFFKDLAKHYDICFLDDFKHILGDFNTNYYGMLDQLIASRGRVFFGTFHSTFTGYINRLRGYHTQNLKLKGYQNGTGLRSYYFAPMANKYVMDKYYPLYGAFFNREFPTAWRDINRGIDELV